MQMSSMNTSLKLMAFLPGDNIGTLPAFLDCDRAPIAHYANEPFARSDQYIGQADGLSPGTNTANIAVSNRGRGAVLLSRLSVYHGVALKRAGCC